MQTLEILTLEEIKTLIANAHVQKAINSLIDLSKNQREGYHIDNQTSKEILLLSSRFKSMASKQRQGVITQAEVDLETNKINLSLIDLIDEMESTLERPVNHASKPRSATWAIYSIVSVAIIGAIIVPLMGGQEEVASPVVSIEESEMMVENASAGEDLRFMWQADANKYLVYDHGEQLKTTELVFAGNDGIIYDRNTKMTFFLKDFKVIEDNQLRPAQLLSDHADILWRATAAQYEVYVEGKKVNVRESTYSRNDLVVYASDEDKVYLLEDYKNLKDNVFRPGVLMR